MSLPGISIPAITAIVSSQLLNVFEQVSMSRWKEVATENERDQLRRGHVHEGRSVQSCGWRTAG